ncbi:MAG: acyl carrier protein [Acidimicrobiales bacterium]
MTSISGSTESDYHQASGGDDPGPNGSGSGVDDVAGRVRGFLVETFLLGDDDGFRADESLLDAGIIDSTGVMEVVTFLEDSFGISIDDDELVADNLDSVDRLAAFVGRKQTRHA